MDQASPLYVSLEFTPNPNTLKYAVNRTLLEKGAANFVKKEDAEGKSPLALKLFDVNGIEGVMIGKDFVTVTKTKDGEWDSVHKGASTCIKDFLSTDNPVFIGSGATASGNAIGSGSEIEQKIIAILDAEIRPAVAMDGGDITFEKFEDGIVYLSLQGSCSGCPSSTFTLKQGVETRLKAAIPEIKEVVSV